MPENGKRLYVGVDVGGTKIVAALVAGNGDIVVRQRCSTPRQGGGDEIVAATVQLIEYLLGRKKRARRVRAIGMGVPGVVDCDEGRVLWAPNINIAGLDLGPRIQRHFGVPVAMGNDVNVGTVGEKWLGAARFASSAVGIFVGTGIGAGIIQDGKLVRGSREVAGEVGHMIVQMGGPRCGCGAKGCLEAIASRSAIERDIRAAVAEGQKTVLTKIVDGDLKVVRSRMLRQALQQGDGLTRRIFRRAAEALGCACLNVRHLLDPEVIVLGGGVIEACGDFIMPVVEEAVAEDLLPGAWPGGRVVRSTLGDDAVVLGAVALAQELIGNNPFANGPRQVDYPKLEESGFGDVTVDGEVYHGDIYIRANGKVKPRDKAAVKKIYGTTHEIGPEELAKVCKGDAEILVIGAGHKGQAALSRKGERFLRERGVLYVSLPTPLAIRQYNRIPGRKAVLLHVTG